MFLFLILCALMWCPPASAHDPGLSYGRIDHDELVVVVARSEFSDRFPTEDVQAASLLLEEHTMGVTWLAVDGVRCQIGATEVTEVEEDGIELRAPMWCPMGDVWVYHPTWVRGREAGHKHVVEAFGLPVGMVDSDHPSLELKAIPGAWRLVLGRFWLVGVEHILFGFDHIAFVLGLLLVIRNYRDAGWIVTGFTIAHSITLSAAVFDVARPPPGLIEPLIALSVAWVGIENLWDPPAQRRIALTFGLGLIHGFGFAGALTGLGMPKDHAFPALVGFNLGVESGQLLIVGAVLPVLLWLRTKDWWLDRGVRAASVVVIVAGSAWFVLRVWG